jgi:hypothetical protein
MDILELLNRRNDISTFIIHLCRNLDTQSAGQRLRNILLGNPPVIRAFNNSGLYATDQNLDTKAVCFSETPLEHIYTLVADIDNRRCEYQRYGLIFSKDFLREKGASPIWYINHLTIGGSRIRTAFDNLKQSLTSQQINYFREIAPFLEYWDRYPRRDFYWEREWRFKGDFFFNLTDLILGICPESEVEIWERDFPIRFIDPIWGIDKIIKKVAN